MDWRQQGTLLLDARRAMKQGPAAITHRQRTHFAEMVAYTGAHSPYYRELYRNLPERIDDPARLPVTSKNELMERFDDWATDRPDPCPCGNPLLAIRVQGRSADVLKFPTEHGEPVAIPPLAFGSLADRTPGVELFQIVQIAPTTLRVRLSVAIGTDPDRVWQAVQSEIARLLAAHKLGYVAVERAEEPPEQSSGGKVRIVIPQRH